MFFSTITTGQRHSTIRLGKQIWNNHWLNISKRRNIRTSFSQHLCLSQSATAVIDDDDDDEPFRKKKEEDVNKTHHLHHAEFPDSPDEAFSISYTLPPIELDFVPKLSNFKTAKRAYKRMVENGNKEQKQVYVDDNALYAFNKIFPEIVNSRNIGKLRTEDFETWDYRLGDKKEDLLLRRVFDLVDKDGSGDVSLHELNTTMKNAGILSHDDNKFFQKIDLDKNGQIDFHEFQLWWRNMTTTTTKERVKHEEKLKEFCSNQAQSLVENNVEVILESDETLSTTKKPEFHVDFLCVGGPSTYVAAALHKAQHPHQSVMHVVSSRFDSNADGSAYYYHERDAFPLYVNEVNVGYYCVYADLEKRFTTGKRLAERCKNDRHLVKISLNYANLLREWYHIFSIFIPNTYHSFMDLILRKPEHSLMAQACLHAQKTPKIVSRMCSALGLPERAFLCIDPDRAVYVDVDGKKQAQKHFAWLNQYAHIPFHSLSNNNNNNNGFGPMVTDVLAFPKDGALNAWIFDNFYTAFQKTNIAFMKNWVLDCIYVKPDDIETHRIRCTKVQLQNRSTGETKVVSVNKLALSLGPSGRVVVVNDDDDPNMKNKKNTISQSRRRPPPSLRTVLNHLQQTLNPIGTSMFKDTMWAAGSSSVCLLGIKRGAVTEGKLGIFRKFIDGVNQHWTLIREREVRIVTGENKDDIYDFFAIQMTGGGNFPSRYTKPDYVLNLLYTTEAIFGLDTKNEGDDDDDDDDDVIIYDIVQSRGCGRSVSARNTIGFSPIAMNVVAAYGLGGIGMTTAFSNGAMQVQLLDALAEKGSDKTLLYGSSSKSEGGGGGIQEGIIGNEHAMKRLKGFYGENVFEGVNYGPIVDDPQTVARSLGVDNSLSRNEKWWCMGGMLLASSSILSAGLAALF